MRGYGYTQNALYNLPNIMLCKIIDTQKICYFNCIMMPEL